MNLFVMFVPTQLLALVGSPGEQRVEKKMTLFGPALAGARELKISDLTKADKKTFLAWLTKDLACMKRTDPRGTASLRWARRSGPGRDRGHHRGLPLRWIPLPARGVHLPQPTSLHVHRDPADHDPGPRGRTHRGRRIPPPGHGRLIFEPNSVPACPRA